MGQLLGVLLVKQIPLVDNWFIKLQLNFDKPQLARIVDLILVHIPQCQRLGAYQVENNKFQIFEDCHHLLSE